MPPGLPAIVPRARFDEVAGPTNGFGGVDEVRGRGEEFVGEGEDAGGQRGGDEVCTCQLMVFWAGGVCKDHRPGSRGGVELVEVDWRGALPMHVVPKVLSIWSGGMESVGVDWVS